jgi:hypothetical protein
VKRLAFAALILMLLFACTNYSKFCFGKWKFIQFEVNGVAIDSLFLKDSFFELTNNGAYQQTLFGTQESGVFAIDNDTLKLDCHSNKDIADKYFLLTKPDSTHLVLTSSANGNNLKITLLKI